ncbi:hypothetical protein PVAP13_1KG087377, partial [Panicum virgatum]
RRKRCCSAVLRPSYVATRHPWCRALRQYHPGQDQVSSRLLDPAPNSPGHRPAGHRLWPLRGSHLGTAPHPRPWGPRGEDQPLVDTAGKTRTHASLLSRQCHVWMVVKRSGCRSMPLEESSIG